MTDHAAFGVSFESNDLFVPAAEKKAQASKKLLDADDSSSNKPGHVLKSLLPAGGFSGCTRHELSVCGPLGGVPAVSFSAIDSGSVHSTRAGGRGVSRGRGAV